MKSNVLHAILAFICSSQLSSAQDGSDAQRLYMVKVDGKFGFIDSQGVIQVPPRYDHVLPFDRERSLAWVKDGGCQLIDSKGNKVADAPLTHELKPFSEGFARGSGKAGSRFIDRSGKLLPGIYLGVGPFSEGLAAVHLMSAGFGPGGIGRRSSGKWGYIGANGELVIPADYHDVGRFSHGLAPVYVGGKMDDRGVATGGKWGFINTRGAMIIEPRYNFAASFSDGLAMVQFEGNSRGYIDTEGETVIEPRPFLMADPFYEGLAAIRGGEVQGGRFHKGFGYMDKSGKVVISEKFGFATEFSEGLAAVRASPSHSKRQWGFIDKKGEWVVEAQFDDAQPFKGGLALVVRDGQIAYIDRKGGFVWPFKE